MRLIKDIKLLILFQTYHLENSHCSSALNEDKDQGKNTKSNVEGIVSI